MFYIILKILVDSKLYLCELDILILSSEDFLLFLLLLLL